MNTSNALEVLLAGHEWSMKNNDLSTLIVHDGALPPTQVQVDAWIKANSYIQQRAKEYPSIGDQLDCVWKCLATSGIPMPQDASDMLKKIQDIKAKYPAPVTPVATIKGA
jgi:hypothetical protein